MSDIAGDPVHIWFLILIMNRLIYQCSAEKRQVLLHVNASGYVGRGVYGYDMIMNHELVME